MIKYQNQRGRLDWEIKIKTEKGMPNFRTELKKRANITQSSILI